MRWIVAILSIALVSCSAGPGVSPAARSPEPSGTATTSAPSASPTPGDRDASNPPDPIVFPRPNRRIPRAAGRFARELRYVTAKLPLAIDGWLEAGGRRRSPRGRTVTLGALWQQRFYRKLVEKPRLTRHVLRRLPPQLRRRVDAHVDVGRGLRALVTPLKPPVRLRTNPPTPHRKLSRFYRKAQRRFDIPWQILASVNFVESKFGRILGPSSAGARGPMQFLPSTWDAYGRGDIMDPHDSIMGAARYLRASGAPRDMRGALFAYNRSDAYVDAILTYASQMARDRRNFYAYYFWQVFVITTRGDLQLTGPGRDRRSG